MKNYKIVLLLISMILITVSCQNDADKNEEISNTYRIEGEISGLENNHLYFRIPNKNYDELGYRHDSIVVSNNKFKFSDSINDYAFVTFSTRIKKLRKTTKSGGFYPVKSAYLNLMIYPGANIKIEGEISDFMNAYPSGDSTNDDFNKLHKEVFPLMNEQVNYLVKSSFEEDANIKAKLNEKADSVSTITSKIKQDFVSNNPNSIAALYYLSDMMMRSQIGDDDAITAFKKLNKDFSEITYYEDVSKRVVAINSTTEGSLAPTIKTTSTLDGIEFDLSSFKGKYVMIDFWGIWCGPCVAEMPTVKEFLEKHEDKLAVLGVNSGDKKEKIINFVAKNNYNWQQVLNVKGSDSENFVLNYNVAGFPTKFILDPEGNIVKKFVGSGEEAFELLEELLK